MLEHNFSKDVSNGPVFLWQTLIQTIEYDTDKKERSYAACWYFTHIHTPSDINFQMIFVPKVILDFFCKKAGTLEPFLC